MRVSGWLLVLAACGEKADDTGSGGDTDATDSDTIGNTDTGGGGGTDTPPEPQQLHGALVDEAGAPITGVQVKFCNTAGCRIASADGSGAFAFDEAVTGAYSLEPVPPAGKATVLVPITLDPNEEADVTLVVPDLDAAHPLSASPTELELGSGLFVTVSTDLVVPFAEPDPTEAAGVRAPTLPPIEGVTGTPLAAWYLAPFNYKSDAGLPFRIADEWDLGGATLHVWVASYDDFAWLDAGEVTAHDGYLTGSGKLPLLSTVVLVQP